MKAIDLLDNLLEQVAGVSQSPMCWTLTGYLSGYFSLAFGQNLLCLETTCVGQGETRCVAIVKPIAAWGEAARQSATDPARMENTRKNTAPQQTTLSAGTAGKHRAARRVGRGAQRGPLSGTARLILYNSLF